MLKKMLHAAISMVLALAITFVTCTNALAASSKNSYVKDVILSYGKTAEEAKTWLTNNGYDVLDYNLNEGADDTFSTKRAVYLGYTTTNDAEEAITDMRLMNMKGGYSVQDYQMLLEDQKATIKLFLDDFIVAVNEYRDNYKKGQQRAVAAHEILNLLYDDDTQQYLGDLLLNKIKEEYSDEEWNALSEKEQAKIADMTTILMQANSDAVLVIEQTIAMAADTGDTLWLDRYASAKTYDEMADELMESKNLPINEAEKQLAAQYDDDAKAIASKFEDYRTYLENYTNAGVDFSSTEEEIAAYQKSHTDLDYTNWFAAGTQYELLATMKNDDISLLELITSDEYDIENDERYLLYPLVASLSEGQRACLDFLPMYLLVTLGINGDDAAKSALASFDFNWVGDEKNSIYEGVDRTIFSGDVALTNEALRLQASSGNNAVGGALDSISTTSLILWGTFGFSVMCMTALWIYDYNANWTAVAEQLGAESDSFFDLAAPVKTKLESKLYEKEHAALQKQYDEYMAKSNNLMASCGRATTLAKVVRYASIAFTCISFILMGISLWHTYTELKAYYNAEFTPIPLHMVDESVNDQDEKVYTYYNAVTCNRKDANMVTDATKLLGDFGDLNGDVGRQWVALYTTKDKAAGNPITTDFKVQYEDTNLPNEDYSVLSMFGEDVAQNLTNKKSGYTYADGKSGIYLFFNTDKTAFAGSVFTNNQYVLVSAAVAVVVGVAAFFAGKNVKRKPKEQTAEA